MRHVAGREAMCSQPHSIQRRNRVLTLHNESNDQQGLEMSLPTLPMRARKPSPRPLLHKTKTGIRKRAATLDSGVYARLPNHRKRSPRAHPRRRTPRPSARPPNLLAARIPSISYHPAGLLDYWTAASSYCLGAGHRKTAIREVACGDI